MAVRLSDYWDLERRRPLRLIIVRHLRIDKEKGAIPPELLPNSSFRYSASLMPLSPSL